MCWGYINLQGQRTEGSSRTATISTYLASYPGRFVGGAWVRGYHLRHQVLSYELYSQAALVDWYHIQHEYYCNRWVHNKAAFWALSLQNTTDYTAIKLPIISTCIYMYVYCVHLQTCTCTCTCMCVCVHVHVRACMYMYMYVHVCTCTCTCMYVHVHVDTRGNDCVIEHYIMRLTLQMAQCIRAQNNSGQHVSQVLLCLQRDMFTTMWNVHNTNPQHTQYNTTLYMHMYTCTNMCRYTRH